MNEIKVLLSAVAAIIVVSCILSFTPMPIDNSVLSKLKSTTVLFVSGTEPPPDALLCTVRAVTTVAAAMTGSVKVRISLRSPRFKAKLTSSGGLLSGKTSEACSEGSDLYIFPARSSSELSAITMKVLVVAVAMAGILCRVRKSMALS